MYAWKIKEKCLIKMDYNAAYTIIYSSNFFSIDSYDKKNFLTIEFNENVSSFTNSESILPEDTAVIKTHFISHQVPTLIFLFQSGNFYSRKSPV